MLKAKINALYFVVEFIRNSMSSVIKKNHKENFVLLRALRVCGEQSEKLEKKPPQPPDKLSFYKN